MSANQSCQAAGYVSVKKDANRAPETSRPSTEALLEAKGVSLGTTWRSCVARVGAKLSYVTKAVNGNLLIGKATPPCWASSPR